MADLRNTLPWPSDTCHRHVRSDSSLSLKIQTGPRGILAVVAVASFQMEGPQAALSEVPVAAQNLDQCLKRNNGLTRLPLAEVGSLDALSDGTLLSTP